MSDNVPVDFFIILLFQISQSVTNLAKFSHEPITYFIECFGILPNATIRYFVITINI